MNRNSIRSIFISLFLLISCFMNVGNSSFVINEESKKDGITIKDGSQAVCHIGDTKYTSIAVNIMLFINTSLASFPSSSFDTLSFKNNTVIKRIATIAILISALSFM